MSKLLCIVSLLLLLEDVGWAVHATPPLSFRRRYESIFSFGSSYADTGNNPVVFAENSVADAAMRPPYGSTFFGRPTGRGCDGRLIIDFIGCEKYFGRSLFIVGEFGVNDYHHIFDQTMEAIMAPAPDVISNISMGIERLIKHGAKSLLVPGMIPSGCLPMILHNFPKDDPEEYNSTTEALGKLQNMHPCVSIIYGDLFGPMMEMVESPAKFGIREDVLTMCCGGPGDLFCGDGGANVCKEPSTHMFWDNIQLTEARYRDIADRWLRSIASSTRDNS